MKSIISMRMLFILLLTSVIAVSFAQQAKTETGTASFYHDKFVGRKTANGEIFTQDKMTAAHKTLPLGSWVKVTNLKNDSTIIVRINDRMPLYNKRTIDLTYAGAGALNFINSGLTKVFVEIIPDPTKNILTIIRPSDLPQEPITMIKIRTIEYDNTRVIGLSPIRDLIDWEVYYVNKVQKKRK